MADGKKQKKQKKAKKHSRLWLLPICYTLCILVYLGMCLFGMLRQDRWAANGTLQTERLGLDAFQLESILVLEPEILVDEEGRPVVTDCVPTEDFVTTDSDPQMIYTRADGAAFAPGIVTFAAHENRPTGEIVLYYTTKPGQGFSDNRRAWATLGEEGYWQFDLTGRRVYSLRLDPDSTELGVLWQMQYVEVGGKKSAGEFFTPTPVTALLVLALPLLAWAALREAFAALDFAVTGHMLKRRNKKENQTP